MTPQELETCLHEQIPLTRHMQVRVEPETAAGLVLSAPLAPNANIHGTAFGGSIASLAVLAGWGLLQLRTLDQGLNCALVVQKSEINYERAIEEDFQAFCATPGEDEWQRFVKMLTRRGKARIQLGIEVRSEDRVAARVLAVYAAETIPLESSGT